MRTIPIKAEIDLDTRTIFVEVNGSMEEVGVLSEETSTEEIIEE